MRRLYEPLAYGLHEFKECLASQVVVQQARPGSLSFLVPSSSSESTSLTYPVALEAVLTAEEGLLS